MRQVARHLSDCTSGSVREIRALHEKRDRATPGVENVVRERGRKKVGRVEEGYLREMELSPYSTQPDISFQNVLDDDLIPITRSYASSQYSRLHKRTESASQSRASSLALPPCFWTCLSTSGKAMPCSATTARRRDGPVSFGAGLKRGSAPSRSLRVEVYLFSVKNDFPLEVQARTYVFRKSPLGDSFTPINIVAPLLSSLQPLT